MAIFIPGPGFLILNALKTSHKLHNPPNPKPYRNPRQVEEINRLFVEARDEIEMALEDSETVGPAVHHLFCDLPSAL